MASSPIFIIGDSTVAYGPQYVREDPGGAWVGRHPAAWPAFPIWEEIMCFVRSDSGAVLVTYLDGRNGHEVKGFIQQAQELPDGAHFLLVGGWNDRGEGADWEAEMRSNLALLQAVVEARNLHPARVCLLEPEPDKVESTQRLERIYAQALPWWPVLDGFPALYRTLAPWPTGLKIAGPRSGPGATPTTTTASGPRRRRPSSSATRGF